jgi:predicted 2-oxoglutarate/Fe(II)-dependent dioxygenase YbiX
MKNPFLSDYIRIYRNFIDIQTCSDITNLLASQENIWRKHSWTSYDEKKGKLENHTKEDDFIVTDVISEEMQKFFEDALFSANQMYSDDLKMDGSLISNLSSVRINRYTTGTKMHEHFDAIKSLFESGRGSPTLSFLGALNNDYTGGEFFMFDNMEIKLNAGDVMIFPSAFMYNHRVDTVKSGERWTFVSWGF